jgi:hypothetical protein
MSRLFWFLGGAVAGIATMSWLDCKIKFPNNIGCIFDFGKFDQDNEDKLFPKTNDETSSS